MTKAPAANAGTLDPRVRAFYQHVLDLLLDARIPFLVGGAYSLERYTGIARDTGDFDIFARQEDWDAICRVAIEAGYHAEIVFPHWLGKIFSGPLYVDIIFSSGNAIARVDDEWFIHAVEETVLERQVRLCPVEETIWSKAFIMERERYDGADVAHLLRARGRKLDWTRLLRRFGPHWRVLLSHLVLFGFIYPGERDVVPPWVTRTLLDRLCAETEGCDGADASVCQGTILSREQYLTDLEWGLDDARRSPRGPMTDAEIAVWTAAIGEAERKRDGGDEGPGPAGRDR